MNARGPGRPITLAIALALLLSLAGPAPVAAYRQTSEVDGTSVAFIGPDTELGRKDVDLVKKAFDDAIAKSQDLREKVKHAGSHQSDTFIISVRSRGSTFVINGTANPAGGIVSLDMSDIERVRDFLTSEKKDPDRAAADVAKVAAAFLLHVLAHEIDHLRDGKEKDPAKLKHVDPEAPPGSNVAPLGEPDKDANRVLKELGTEVQRVSYSAQDAEGTSVIEFVVDGQKVTYDAPGWWDDRSGERKYFEPAHHIVDPSVLERIPDRPCTGDARSGCYRPAATGDADLDGVPDGTDNARGLANPQQADLDGDGTGSGVDPDDDGDGLNDALEMAAGGDPTCADCALEHWAKAPTCADGRDNDGDGLIDGGDAGCLAPPTASDALPAPVAAEYPIWLRPDLGAPHDTLDLVPVVAEVALDADRDGVVDLRRAQPGLVAIERTDPADADRDGLGDVRLTVLYAGFTYRDLGGALASAELRLVTRYDPGALEARRAAGGFPATGSLKLRAELRRGGALVASAALEFTARLTGWPAYGSAWRLRAPATLVDRNGRPLARIASASLSFGQPPPGPPGGRIVFASDRDGDFEIYSLNLDGTGLAQLTHNSAADTEPSLSPDGRRVAFVSDRDGNPEIYVMDADGGAQQRLTVEPALDDAPAWSPDGAHIAFASERGGGLAIAGLLGRLLPTVIGPDRDIWLMGADGGGPRNLTRHPGLDDAPAWSPDGARVAFHSGRDGNLEVYAMAADGSGQTNLTRHPADDGSPAWSPDGSAIAFVTARDGLDELYRMAPDGSDQSALRADSAAHDREPAYCRSALGGPPLLVWAREEGGNADLWSRVHGAADPLRLTSHPASDAQPACAA